MESLVINPVYLLSPRDTAKALSISSRTLWQLTNCGEIPCVRIGRSVRYRPESLAKYLAEQEKGGQR